MKNVRRTLFTFFSFWAVSILDEKDEPIAAEKMLEILDGWDGKETHISVDVTEERKGRKYWQKVNFTEAFLKLRYGNMRHFIMDNDVTMIYSVSMRATLPFFNTDKIANLGQLDWIEEGCTNKCSFKWMFTYQEVTELARKLENDPNILSATIEGKVV